MRDAEHHDPRHPRENLAAQQHRAPPAATQDDLRSHPRGRLWQTLPPVLRRGPWTRVRNQDRA